MLHDEPIIFRTRTVILTNRNLFIDGTKYNLAALDTVRHGPAAHFWALQAGRVITSGLALLLALTFINRLRDGASVWALALPLLGTLVLGFAAYVLVTQLAAYSVTITTGQGRVRVLHSDAEYVALVARKITAARDQLHAAED